MAILRAKTSFNVGRRRFIREGDLVDENDPIVKGRDGLFEDIASYVQRTSDAPVKKAVAKKAAAKKAAAKKAED